MLQWVTFPPLMTMVVKFPHFATRQMSHIYWREKKKNSDCWDDVFAGCRQSGILSAFATFLNNKWRLKGKGCCLMVDFHYPAWWGWGKRAAGKNSTTMEKLISRDQSQCSMSRLTETYMKLRQIRQRFGPFPLLAI